mmetsp:Transcript_7141/g.15756  ORF Transcript_7141/g.15756 Transcript_7141/m.15756 type:complete len:379 (+) Transcript_7141:3219-4355(+)
MFEESPCTLQSQPFRIPMFPATGLIPRKTLQRQRDFATARHFPPRIVQKGRIGICSHISSAVDYGRSSRFRWDVVLGNHRRGSAASSRRRWSLAFGIAVSRRAFVIVTRIAAAVVATPGCGREGIVHSIVVVPPTIIIISTAHRRRQTHGTGRLRRRVRRLGRPLIHLGALLRQFQLAPQLLLPLLQTLQLHVLRGALLHELMHREARRLLHLLLVLRLGLRARRRLRLEPRGPLPILLDAGELGVELGDAILAILLHHFEDGTQCLLLGRLGFHRLLLGFVLELDQLLLGHLGEEGHALVMGADQFGAIVLHFAHLQSEVGYLVEEAVVLGGVLVETVLGVADFGLVFGPFAGDGIFATAATIAGRFFGRPFVLHLL